MPEMKHQIITLAMLLALPGFARASVAQIDEPGILPLLLLTGTAIAMVRFIRRK